MPTSSPTSSHIDRGTQQGFKPLYFGLSYLTLGVTNGHVRPVESAPQKPAKNGAGRDIHCKRCGPKTLTRVHKNASVARNVHGLSTF